MTRIKDKGEAARLAAELHALERLYVLHPGGGTWDHATSDGRVMEAQGALVDFMDGLTFHPSPHRPGDTGVRIRGVCVSDMELYDLLEGMMYSVNQMVETRRRALDALKEEECHGEGC